MIIMYWEYMWCHLELMGCCQKLNGGLKVFYIAPTDEMMIGGIEQLIEDKLSLLHV